MSVIIKSPFKFDRIETDPSSYGLRESIIKDCIIELYNDKSILITGARGIGKSSLSFQLQNVLLGEDTLLTRCSIEIDMPAYITVSYICTSYDSLESIVVSIIKELDKQMEVIKPNYKLKKFEIGFSLFSIISSKLEIESYQKENSLLSSLVDVIEKIHETYEDLHINIALDELDQLDKQYNIAHFIKILLETLSRRDLSILSFILSGQPALLNNLLVQQPAFHRLVKHIDLKPLNDDNSLYVLEACLNNSDIETRIGYKAEDLLLSVAGGYPYTIHKLGHESFYAMGNRYSINPPHFEVVLKDVLSGLRNLLIDFTPRFEQILYDLSEEEAETLHALINAWGQDTLDKLPATFTQDTMFNKLRLSGEVIDTLCKKQILESIKQNASINYKDQGIIFKFREEVFRIFLSWINKNIDPISRDLFE